MEKDQQLMAELTELVQEAKTSFHISVKTLKDDFSSSCHILILEMTEDVDALERVLRSATKADDPSKAYNLLETLKTFLHQPNKAIEILIKAKLRQLSETKQIFNDYLTVKRDETLKLRRLLIKDDPISSLESTELGPNSLSTATKMLQQIAPLCSVPDHIVPDQIYAVLTNDHQWFSATVGLPSGIFQVGDEPAETLYECLLLLNAYGRKERISKKNIRELPINFFAGLQALTSKGSAPIISSMSGIADTDDAAETNIPFPKLPTTKTLLSSGPAKEASLKNTSSPTNRSSAYIASPVPPERASLDHLRLKEPQIVNRTFKPKFSPLELTTNPLQYAVVVISDATLPNSVYIQFEDEDVPLYYQMLEDLENDFNFSSRRSPSYCQVPVPGHSYAVKIGHRWRRVLVEMSTRGLLVFNVDTGFRTTIQPAMEFHELPHRFMDLPAQAIRCSLDGVFRPRNPGGFKGLHYPEETYKFMALFRRKPAVAFFSEWLMGQVGHTTEKSPFELMVGAILYPMDDVTSINLQLGYQNNHLAYVLTRKLAMQVPKQNKIRLELINAQGSKWPASTISNLNKRLAPAITSTTCLNSKKDAEEEAIQRAPQFNNDSNMTTIRVTFVGCTSPQEIHFRTPEMMQDFIRIQNSLHAHFQANEESTDEEPTTSLGVGFDCAVKCVGRWYRAKVVHLETDGKVTVSLMDKGYSTTVDDSEIHRLPDGLEAMPMTKICCSLYGIGPPLGSIWDQKVGQYITDRLNGADLINIQCQNCPNAPEGKILPITVYISKGETDPDKVSDDVQMRSVNLNEELVSLGLASTFSQLR